MSKHCETRIEQLVRIQGGQLQELRKENEALRGAVAAFQENTLRAVRTWNVSSVSPLPHEVLQRQLGVFNALFDPILKAQETKD